MKKAFNIAAHVAIGLSMAAMGAVHVRNESRIHRITSADPVGRVMTAGEISMAQGIFGDSINYALVRIHKAPAMGDMATTWGSDIYMQFPSLQGPDLSRENPGKAKMLVHELTHVGQNQKPFSAGKVWLALRTVPGHLLYAVTKNVRVYDYDLSPDKSFGQLNQEQQAAMAEDYFNAKATLNLPLCKEAAAARAHTAVCDGSAAQASALLPRLRTGLPVPGAKGPG
ncbi:MAG: hypothetical protein ACAH83_02910 [Alphaproteobacteria bacterium]